MFNKRNQKVFIVQLDQRASKCVAQASDPEQKIQMAFIFLSSWKYKTEWDNFMKQLKCILFKFYFIFLTIWI